MQYVKMVSSTLKKGCDVELGPRTVLVGPNGAGKSTVVQSIELAANGWVSDMEGRSRVKLHTALARLFPEGTARYSKIELSDGSVCSWELEDGPKPGSYKKPEHNPPVNLRWPVQDLMEVLRGDVSTVASWLEEQVVGDMKEAQLLSALPPAVRDIAREFIKKSRKADFMALAKEAKNEAKNLRTQATRIEKTVESMTEGIAPPLTDEEREELEEQLTKLTAPVSGVSQEQYDQAKKGVEDLANDLAELQVALSSIQAPSAAIAEAVKKIITVQQLIRTHADVFGLDDCWVCGSKKPDFVGNVNRIAEAKTQLATHLQAAEKRQKVEAAISEMEDKLAGRVAVFKGLKVAAGSNDSVRREVIGQIAADDAARKTWNNADAQKKEVDQLRSRADVLNVAGSAFEKAGKNYLDKCKNDFENTVSQYLPTGERIGVDLESGRFGLQRDGELHSALSGAEWSRVVMALAASQERGRTPAIIVPEDRAWDADTLTRVMEAMNGCAVQVIIMSTVRPKDVDGWTILEVE